MKVQQRAARHGLRGTSNQLHKWQRLQWLAIEKRRERDFVRGAL